MKIYCDFCETVTHSNTSCPWQVSISTQTISECKNLAVWLDGTLRPAKGHNGTCKWFFDGQFTYHTGDIA